MLKFEQLNVYDYTIKGLITEQERKEISEYLISEHLRLLKEDPGYKKTSYNFRINNYNYVFDRLYDCFFDISIKLFGNLTLSERNNSSCWAQVSSRDDSNSCHNHINTSTINSVFYLSVPDDKSGKLLFCDNNGYEIANHQPFNDNLIIFPNYAYHLPTTCDNDDYRIAINMEILCEENVWGISDNGSTCALQA